MRWGADMTKLRTTGRPIVRPPEADQLEAETEEARQLSALGRAFRALAEASSLEEVKLIRDQAEAVRVYARSASMGLEVQDQAAELKLRCERKGGELLTGMHLRGGNRRSNSRRESWKLEQLGIDHNQSHRWQLEASVPDEEFRNSFSVAARNKREI